MLEKLLELHLSSSSDLSDCCFQEEQIKINHVVSNQQLSVHEQVKSLITLLCELKEAPLASETKKGILQKSLLDVLSVYLTLAYPTLEQYQDLIRFIYEQDKKTTAPVNKIERTQHQKLVQDLVILKARHLNDLKNIDALKKFSLFLDALKKDYGFGATKEEKELIIAVSRRIQDIPYEIKHKRFRSYDDAIELLTFKTELLFRQFFDDSYAIKFALYLMELQIKNKIPFSTIDKKMLLDLMQSGSGVLEFSSETLAWKGGGEVLVYFFDHLNEFLKNIETDEEIKKKSREFLTTFLQSANEAQWRSSVFMVKEGLRDVFTGNNIQAAFKKFDALYGLLKPSIKPSIFTEKSPFVDQSINANPIFSAVYDVLNTRTYNMFSVQEFWPDHYKNEKAGIFLLNQQTDVSKENAHQFIHYALERKLSEARTFYDYEKIIGVFNGLWEQKFSFGEKTKEGIKEKKDAFLLKILQCYYNNCRHLGDYKRLVKFDFRHMEFDSLGSVWEALAKKNISFDEYKVLIEAIENSYIAGRVYYIGNESPGALFPERSFLKLFLTHTANFVRKNLQKSDEANFLELIKKLEKKYGQKFLTFEDSPSAAIVIQAPLILMDESGVAHPLQIRSVKERVWFRDLFTAFEKQLTLSKTGIFSKGLSESDKSMINGISHALNSDKNVVERGCKDVLSLLYQAKVKDEFRDDSVQQKMIVDVLIGFMAMPTPTASFSLEEYQSLIYFLCDLKCLYGENFIFSPRFTEYDQKLIRDLLVIKAQSLSTSYEFQKFSKFLSKLKQKYYFFRVEGFLFTEISKLRLLTKKSDLEAVKKLSLEAINHRFFKTEKYDEAEFSEYCKFIEQLSVTHQKESVDSKFMMQLLAIGIKQLSNYLENTDSSSYQKVKDVSERTDKFIQFLKNLHQNTNFPEKKDFQLVCKDILILETRFFFEKVYRSEISTKEIELFQWVYDYGKYICFNNPTLLQALFEVDYEIITKRISAENILEKQNVSLFLKSEFGRKFIAYTIEKHLNDYEKNGSLTAKYVNELKTTLEFSQEALTILYSEVAKVARLEIKAIFSEIQITGEKIKTLALSPAITTNLNHLKGYVTTEYVEYIDRYNAGLAKLKKTYDQGDFFEQHEKKALLVLDNAELALSKGHLTDTNIWSITVQEYQKLKDRVKLDFEEYKKTGEQLLTDIEQHIDTFESENAAKFSELTNQCQQFFEMTHIVILSYINETEIALTRTKTRLTGFQEKVARDPEGFKRIETNTYGKFVALIEDLKKIKEYLAQQESLLEKMYNSINEDARNNILLDTQSRQISGFENTVKSIKDRAEEDLLKLISPDETKNFLGYLVAPVPHTSLKSEIPKIKLVQQDFFDHPIKDAYDWLASIKKQETANQAKYESTQKNYDAVLSEAETAMKKLYGQLDNQWKLAKLFDFMSLKKDQASPEVFLSYEESVKQPFDRLGSSLPDMTLKFDEKKRNFEANIKKMEQCLADTTLTIVAQNIEIEKLSQEQTAITEAIKNLISSQTSMINTALKDAKEILAEKTHEVTKEFKHQIGIREVKAEKLTNVKCVIRQLPNLVNQVLSHLATALKTAENILSDNKIKNTAIEFALFLFDNWVFSWIPFISKLKMLSADQKELAIYAKHLTNLQGAVQELQTASEIQVDKITQINENLTGDVHYLQKKSQIFVEQVSQDLLKDESQRVSWKSTNRLLENQAASILGILQAIHSSSVKNINIETVNNDLTKLQGELTILRESEYAFTGKVAEQQYQDQLEIYRLNTGVSPLLQVLNEQDISFAAKKRYLSDLIKGDSDKEVPAYNVNQIVKEGKTLLHLAIEQGYVEMVKFLVEQGADVNAVYQGKSTLFLAFKANQLEIIIYLRGKNALDTHLNLSDLFIERVKEGNLSVVKFLLDENEIHLNINTKFPATGNTALHEAIATDGLELAQLLLKKPEIKLDTLNNQQQSPLKMAVDSKKIAFVKLFLDRGENLKQFSENEKNSLLYLAIKAGDAALVTQFLNEGANIKLMFNVEAKDTQGNNPLHLAVVSGYEDVLHVLLERTRWWLGTVPIAAFNEPNNLGDMTLHVASRNGKLSIVNALLAARVNRDALNQSKYTALHLAITMGHLAIAKCLLAAGSNVTIANTEGNTVLHSMAKRGHLELIQALIDREKSAFYTARTLSSLINVKNAKGETALHVAMESFNLTLIELLIENGADVHSLNQAGKAPFENEKGALVFERIRDKRGQGGNRLFETLYQTLKVTRVEEKYDQYQAGKSKIDETQVPLSNLSNDFFMHYRFSSENKWMVKGIIARKNAAPLITMRDGVGNTILHAVAEKKDVKLAEFIKQQIAKQQDWCALLNAVNGEGETPLHIAVREKSLALTQFLLKEGVKDIPNHQEKTAWIIALEAKNPQLMGLLHHETVLAALIPTLDFMSDETSRQLWMGVLRATPPKQTTALLHAKDKNGNTLLHAAVQKNALADVHFLINLHSDTAIKNVAGQSVLDLAKARREEKMDSWGAAVEEIKNDMLCLLQKNHIPESSTEDKIYDCLEAYEGQIQNHRKRTQMFKNMGFLLAQCLNEYKKLKDCDQSFISLITQILNKGNVQMKAYEAGETLLEQQALDRLLDERHAAISDVKAKILEPQTQVDVLLSTEEPGGTTRDLTIDFKRRRAKAKEKRKEQPKGNDQPFFTDPLETVPKPEPVEAPTARDRYDALNALALQTGNVGVTTDFGETLLHLAVATGDLNIVEALIGQKQLLNTRNTALSTPLDMAIEQHHFDIVTLLIRGGADVSEGCFVRLMNATDKNGQTGLQQLGIREVNRQKTLLTMDLSEGQKQAREEDQQMMRVFMRYAYKLNPENLKNLSVYDLGDRTWMNPVASRQKRKSESIGILAKVTQKVAQLATKVTTQPQNLIDVYEHHKDIFDKDPAGNSEKPGRGVDAIRAMQTWISTEADKKGVLNAVDDEGNTLLHLATEDNMDVVVEWLLPKTFTEQLQMRLNEMGKIFTGVGQTILEKVTSVGAEKLADKLVSEAASVVVGVTVTTATAVFLGPFSIPLGVLAGKATSRSMNTVAEKAGELFSGEIRGNTESLTFTSPPTYIEVNRQNRAGDTPLHIAARDGKTLWMVLAFLAAGADINKQNVAGETPLHVAVRMGNVDVVEILSHISQQNINATNRCGETPLHIAIQKSDHELVGLLSKQGADWHVPTVFKQTAVDLVEIKLALIGDVLSKLTEKEEGWQTLHDQRGAYSLMKAAALKQYASSDRLNEKIVSPIEFQADKSYHFSPLAKPRKTMTTTQVIPQSGAISFAFNT
jgi:ankyrin repeat protein